MNKKLQTLLILFVVYFCTYIFFGKDNLGLQIIQNTSFAQNQDSVQIQIYNLEDYKRNQLKIASILKEKGFKKTTVNYAENFSDKQHYSYWLEIQELVPVVAFAYYGSFKKNEISEEFESLYVWCFFKWIRIYKKKKQQ